MNRRKKQIQAMNRIIAKKRIWAATTEIIIEISEDVLELLMMLHAANMNGE